MTVEEFEFVFDLIWGCFSLGILGFLLFVAVDLCFLSHETRVIQKRIKNRLDSYDKELLVSLSNDLAGLCDESSKLTDF